MATTRNKKTDIQAILDYYLDKHGDIELTNHQEDVRVRLSTAYTMLVNYNSEHQIMPILQKHFHISEAQARRDIKNAVFIFGDITKTSKEGQRNIVYEYAVKAYQVAYSKRDSKAMSMAVGNMIKLRRLDRDDPDMPDFQRLQPNVYPIILAPEVEPVMKKLLAQPGAMNLSKLMNTDAIEAEIIEDEGGDKQTDSE